MLQDEKLGSKQKRCAPTGDAAFEHAPAPLIDASQTTEVFILSLTDNIVWGHNRSKQITGLHFIQCLGVDNVAVKFDYMQDEERQKIYGLISQVVNRNPDFIERFVEHWDGVESPTHQAFVRRNIEFVNRMAMR